MKFKTFWWFNWNPCSWHWNCLVRRTTRVHERLGREVWLRVGPVLVARVERLVDPNPLEKIMQKPATVIPR